MGNDRLRPYDYQLEVARTLLDGHNIVLSAPTGSGKTWAALLPFVYAWVNGTPLADRLLYCLPLRSLAHSLYESTCKALERVAQRFPDMQIPRVTVQTGARKDDPFLQGEIIFTTIDQVLSSYLLAPLSIPKKLSNINSGALVGSLVVLDEIHLLDGQRALKTSLEMVDRLQHMSQFMCMTATLSQPAQQQLAKMLKAKHVALTPDEVKQLPSHRQKERRYYMHLTPLTGEAVVAAHKNRSIIICNSVGRAQEIFQEITHLLGDSETQIFLLHNRFFAADRERIEAQLDVYFGPQATRGNAILVATQVVEAGLDISADQLHSELAPINSLVQRAGRCARYGGERSRGEVHCYLLPCNRQGQMRLGPYRELGSIVEATRQALLASHGKILSFHDEQQILDAVLATMEREQLQVLERDLMQIQQQIAELQRRADGAGTSEVRNLIRHIDNVSVLLTDDTDAWSPYLDIEYLSLPRVSLWALEPYLQQAGELGARILVEEDPEADTYTWVPAQKSLDLFTAGWLIALHPDIAHYSPTRGLVLGEAGPLVEHPARAVSVYPKPNYVCETWLQHAEAVLGQGKKLLVAHAIGWQRVQESLQLPDSNLPLELALLLHDVGKLSVDWQEHIRFWQSRVDPNNETFLLGEPLAHSTFNWAEHQALQAAFNRRRGPHAVPGAFAVQPLIYDCLLSASWPEEQVEGATACIISAIARHHVASAHSLSPFKLVPEAIMQVQRALALLDIQSPLGSDSLLDSPCPQEQRQFKHYLVSDFKWFPLYWLIVRILRLADQASQIEGREENVG